MTTWAVGIITTPRNPPTLHKSYRSIMEAGWLWPRIFYHGEKPSFPCPAIECTNPPGCFQNWLFAAEHLLQDAIEWKLDRILIFEDDVQVTCNLRERLAETELPNGVVSLYCGAINHHDEGGWHRVEKLPKHSHGALAYVWPVGLLESFVSEHWKSEWANGTDSHVGTWCRKNKVDYWCHSPSFVRHTGDVSTIPEAGVEIYRQCREFLA